MSIFIIAEGGINHQGDYVRAMAMAELALEAGADAVKFQTYWGLHDIPNITDELLAQCELTRQEWEMIKTYCDKIGIEFMSTPDTLEAARFLEHLGMKRWKISHKGWKNPSIVNYIMLCASHASMVFVSSTADEISAAINAHSGDEWGFANFLLCSPNYPSKLSDYYLHAAFKYGLFDGISDHTEGICLPIAAATHGATVIEKHFTLNKSLPGPDHWWALDPDELRLMVQKIREVENSGASQ